MKMKPAIFLDRDGTLIEEVNYLSRVEDLRLFASTAKAVRDLKDSGFLVIVVTNQSGIGRGIYVEDAMHAIHEQIQVELGGVIDRFYFCPHLPCDRCVCRKPGLGMIEAAQADFDIDLPRSWIVGDKKIDVETGQLAGMRTALVLTGYGSYHKDSLQLQPDIVADDLGVAAKRILELQTEG
jgi:D-glycero-D-manno-heptose 1,7-bisphosphate phosphatase